MVLMSFMPGSVKAQLGSKVVVGYFHNWNAVQAPYIRLRDVNTKYNVINIAFATPVSNTDMTMTFVPTQQTKAEFISDIQALHAQGRRVQISIGGAEAPIELKTTADRDKFVSSMKTIITEYGFDGYDIDLEGNSVILDAGDTNFKAPTTAKINNLITASRDLVNFFRGQGKDFWLTSAPETQYVQGGYGNYGTAFGGYLPILNSLRDILTFVHVQYYNTGSQNGTDEKIYNQGTADFIVAMTDMLLKGFPVARNSANFFAALREDQVAFGLPATNTGAAPAGGYVSPTEVTKALNYLMKGTSFGGQYVTNKTYPGLRGIMTWSVNWDKTQGDAFANAYYSYFSGLGGGNISPSVSISSPTNNQSFTGPANITIAASASDSDGTVSKVDFYNGSTLLGTDTSSPYSFAWNNVAAGTYTLTAKATDNQNAATTSSAVSITVTGVVTQSPYGGTVRSIPGKIEAEHYDLGGQNVAYNDLSAGNSGTALRTDDVDIENSTDTGTGQNIGWIQAGEWLEYTVNVTTAGSYSLVARVAATAVGKTFHVEMDGSNVSGTITVPNTTGWQIWQSVTVTTTSLSAGQKIMRIYADAGDFNVNYLEFTSSGNPAPTTSITSPSGGATFTAPASVTINATATDNVSVTKVDFYNGTTLLGTDTSSPYSIVWSNVAAGTYSLTTKATDNQGAVGTSSAVSITVNSTGNPAPTTSITSPAGGATFTAPASVTINATATDNVSVTKVDFYNGATLLGTDTSSPYSFAWTGVGAGTYSLTTKATDNQGAVGTSAAVSITVTGGGGNCASIAQYVTSNGGYVPGSIVKNAGSQYECKPWPYSGWCNAAPAAYAPGTGTNWSDAWILKGVCSGGAREVQIEVSEAAANTESEDVTLYPNPGESGKQTWVTLVFEKNAGNVRVNLLNANGTRITTGNYRDVKTHLQVNLPVLTTGFYIIHVQNERKSWVKKYVSK